MIERSAYELREGLRRREWSARELVQQSLQQIGQGHELGAMVEVRETLALAEADAADRRIAGTARSERHTLPPLLGLPTAHKDLVRVRGFTTTHGSAAVPHTLAEQDDPIAAAVRAAGAICVGKTQVPEFGIAGYSENLIAPPARNPFAPARTAGGSSGGTATAIACGMIPAAIGSDAGGSIRIPAGACGLVGLKPGRGAIPADASNADASNADASNADASNADASKADASEADDFGAPRMAVSGPMARTARDAALFFDAARGRADEPSLHALDRAHELRGLRIGVSLDSPFSSRLAIRFDEAALTTLDEAVSRLEAAGHLPVRARFDYGDDYPEAFTTVWTQALTRIPLDTESRSRLGELARWFLDRALAADPQHLASCATALHDFARSATAQWGGYDAVLTPALAFAPPETGEFWSLGPEGDYRLQCEWAPQTSMVNVAGLPAIVVPVAQDAAGLPRGVQLIGRSGSEEQLLQLGAQLLGE